MTAIGFAFYFIRKGELQGGRLLGRCSAVYSSTILNLWINDGKRHEHPASGYGQISAALQSSLTRLGHRIEFEPFEEMELCLFVCPPSSIRNRPEVTTAAFTMHETTGLPPGKKDWPSILNTADLVLTPTSWNRRIWQDLGVRVPIEVVPLGIDDSVFRPRTGRTCTLVTLHENLGSTSSRESWQDTLLAYYSAFALSDRVELVIKTWKWKPDAWQAAQEEVAAKAGKVAHQLPPVRVVDADLSPEEMRSLYQGAWLFVKNANREGWSLPCSEAVACGTNIAATRIQPLLSHLPPDTRWFEPGDALELRYLLKREYQRFLAEEGRSRRYTWDKTAAVLVDRLSSHL